MKILQKFFLISAVFFVFPVSAQQFSGSITNSNSDAVENARVILQYPDGTPENDTVYSDASGYYVIGEIETVGINDIKNNNAEISCRISGNTLYVSVRTDANNRVYESGKLFSITGTLTAQCLLMKTAADTYSGQFKINNIKNGLYIFTDNYNSVKIPILQDRLRQALPPNVRGTSLSNDRRLSLSNNRSLSLSNNRRLSLSNNRRLSLSKPDSLQTPPSTSSGYENKSTKDTYYHLIIQTDNLYQPIDSALENIDPSQSYVYDFTLENWPEFFANLYFNIKGYENIDLENATVEVNGENIFLTDITDSNGNVSFTNVNVGNNPDNMLEAGTKTISNLIGDLDWYQNQTNNETITEGDYNFNYDLQATVNDYIQNLKTENTSGEILGDVTWKLQNADGTETYANGITNATTGESEINYSKQYPGEMSGLELIASKEGWVNDTTATSILPGQVDDLVVDLEQEPAVGYLWRAGQSETSDLGTYFDIVVRNSQFNYNDTLFNIGDGIAWRDTVPVNQNGTTTYTVEYIPHIIEGKIPLYPTTLTFDMTNGETSQGLDTIQALEQEIKYVVNVFDFENESQMKEANVTITDNQGVEWFNGNTIDGIIETSYIPTGDEGDGFEGVMTITPTDGNYFGTRMVITGGDMSGQNQIDLFNNLGVGYKGYANPVPEIQTDFNKTDTISFYLVKQTREDPLHPGTMLQMNTYEIREMESNSIDTETARYGEENIFFREPKPQEYDDYRAHARIIFGYDFVENEVFTAIDYIIINDYSIDNDNYKNVLGWNVSFGNSSTNTVGVNPSLFGKININSRGEVGYDLSDWAGCAREDARKIGINGVTSRVSYMNSSLPPAFPDTLNQKDRIYTNLFLHYRPTQVKQNPSKRNITNLGYLFVPAKHKDVATKPSLRQAQ
ncbi:MAG: hypothetical protein L3J56_01965 [Bacteroidales bacterium]|nr:hypothetical protein [Bacteroidales bacterium]